VVLKWVLKKGQNPKHQSQRLRDLSVYVLIIPVLVGLSLSCLQWSTHQGHQPK